MCECYSRCSGPHRVLVFQWRGEETEKKFAREIITNYLFSFLLDFLFI